MKTSNRDTILDEIHRTRRQMAERFGGDIAAILEDARKRQEASGRVIWQGPSPKQTPQPTAPTPAVSDSSASQSSRGRDLDSAE